MCDNLNEVIKRLVKFCFHKTLKSSAIKFQNGCCLKNSTLGKVLKTFLGIMRIDITKTEPSTILNKPMSETVRPQTALAPVSASPKLKIVAGQAPAALDA